MAMTGAPPEKSDIAEFALRALPAGFFNNPFEGLLDAAKSRDGSDLIEKFAASFPIEAIGCFLARFARYHAADKPIRGGRARFRGFLAFPVRSR